eukprot:gene6280-7287_t
MTTEEMRLEAKEEVRRLVEQKKEEVIRIGTVALRSTRLAERYTFIVTSELPKFLDVFIRLEAIWSVEKFLADPSSFIATYLPQRHITALVDTLAPEDILTLDELSLYLQGYILRMTNILSDLMSLLMSVTPPYETDNHRTILIESLLVPLFLILDALTIHYKQVTKNEGRRVAPSTIDKHKDIQDYRALKDGYEYHSAYTTIVVASMLDSVSLRDQRDVNRQPRWDVDIRIQLVLYMSSGALAIHRSDFNYSDEKRLAMTWIVKLAAHTLHHRVLVHHVVEVCLFV